MDVIVEWTFGKILKFIEILKFIRLTFRKKKTESIKWTISILAVGLIFVHIIFPSLKIDPIVVALILV